MVHTAEHVLQEEKLTIADTGQAGLEAVHERVREHQARGRAPDGVVEPPVTVGGSRYRPGLVSSPPFTVLHFLIVNGPERKLKKIQAASCRRI